MFDIFDNPSLYRRRSLVHGQWRYVKDNLNHNRDKVLEYYHTRVFHVPNEHILVKLLTLSVSIQFNTDYFSFVSTVKDYSYLIARWVKISSPVAQGRVNTPSQFMGSGSIEILVTDESDFDLDSAVKNWRMLEPVKVMNHSFTDLSFPIPNNKQVGFDQGVSVITVNIPMLLLQYRRWVEEEMWQGDTRRTLAQFVAMYPVANMTSSMVEVALFNRLIALEKGIPIMPSKKFHPFMLPNFDDIINEGLEAQLKWIVSNDLDFGEVLTSFPMPFSESLYDVIKIPDGPRNMNTTWIWVIGQMSVVKLFLSIMDKVNAPANRYFSYKIQLFLRKIYADKSLMRIVSSDLRAEIEKAVHETAVAIRY